MSVENRVEGINFVLTAIKSLGDRSLEISPRKPWTLRDGEYRLLWYSPVRVSKALHEVVVHVNRRVVTAALLTSLG